MATSFKKVAISYSGAARVLRSIFGIAIGSGRTVYVSSVTINVDRDRDFAYGIVVKSQGSGEVLWDGPAEFSKITRTPAAPAPEAPAPAPVAEVAAPTEEPAEAAATETPADASEGEAESTAPVEGMPPLIESYHALNSGKAQAFIKKLTSVDELAEIDAWERANKRRSTVFNAISNRLSELESVE